MQQSRCRGDIKLGISPRGIQITVEADDIGPSAMEMMLRNIPHKSFHRLPYQPGTPDSPSNQRGAYLLPLQAGLGAPPNYPATP